MNCSEAKRMQRGYLDHELSYDEEAALREHRSRCARCADEFASLEACVALLRDLPETDPGPAFLPAVMEKIRRAESRGWTAERPRIGWTDRLRAGLGVLIYRPVVVGAGALAVGILLGGGVVHLASNAGRAGAPLIAGKQTPRPAATLSAGSGFQESPISDLAIDIPQATEEVTDRESEDEYLLDPYMPDSQRGLVPVGTERVRTAPGEREQSDVYITF